VEAATFRQSGQTEKEPGISPWLQQCFFMGRNGDLIPSGLFYLFKIARNYDEVLAGDTIDETDFFRVFLVLAWRGLFQFFGSRVLVFGPSFALGFYERNVFLNKQFPVRVFLFEKILADKLSTNEGFLHRSSTTRTTFFVRLENQVKEPHNAPCNALRGCDRLDGLQIEEVRQDLSV